LYPSSSSPLQAASWPSSQACQGRSTRWCSAASQGERSLS
jgi:hypothetical protein